MNTLVDASYSTSLETFPLRGLWLKAVFITVITPIII